MPRSHIELTIDTDPAFFEEFIGAMAGRGFEGFWEDGGTLKAYIANDLWTDPLQESIRHAIDRITSSHSLPMPAMSVAILEDRNWNQVWESTIRPIRVTERIVIAPTWHPHIPRTGDVVLTIDPKMSFGTGYHETTRLMLVLLERHLRPGSRVLDVGTGTGVLAIAALKLGASSAIGIDNDEWSYLNAMENGALNDVADRIDIRLGDLTVVTETGFDMIVANIQRNVIEEILPGLALRLAPGGLLLLSGLLLEDRAAMLRAFDSARLSVIDERRENEWIAFGMTASP